MFTFLADSSFSLFGTLSTILTILGSLGVFLYGMKVMSEGVQKVAGDGMRKALQTMTGNRFKGVLTGLFTTGLVQSSSATTVLVVSFASAGLLTLTESISVIMGANLGTTLTAWIVASIGKFSLSKIAIPIVGLGLPFFFIGKNRAKGFGEFLIGFGLLFFGLTLLKGAVPDLKTLVKEDPETAESIQQWIIMLNGKGFFSIILFCIAGVALTVIVQSSSAAMAITITCAINGWFGSDPYRAFQISAAVVMGENIGTTITAWLASIGSGSDAKRAARAHFLFNIVGVIWMLLAFSLFTAAVWKATDWLPDSLKSAKKDFGKSEVAFATAIFHTSFNLINISVLIWFVPQIANIVRKWVKADTSEPRLTYMSQSLVDLGELNLLEAESAVKKMSNITLEMFNGFVEVLETPSIDLGSKVKALKAIEETVDHMMEDITDYLIRCSSHEVGVQNATKIAAMIRIVTELEECSDIIYRLVKLLERKYNKGREFSEQQMKEVREMAETVGQLMRVTDNSLLEHIPADVYGSAHRIEEQTDRLRKLFNGEAMKRMKSGNIPTAMLNIDLNNHLEALANHALNIMQTSTETTQK